MNISIITDSTCDLGQAGAAAHQIDIVPLSVAFGEKIYRDGIDMSSSEFYNRLVKSGTLPTTSQPSPATFETLFRMRLDEGKDIVGLFLSAALSGTYQSAVIARSCFTNEEQTRIHLLDSMHATGNLAILVLEACKMRDQGAGAREIVSSVTALIPRVKLYAALDTLKYLRMGGRMSAAAAVAGEFLLIAPVVSIANGKVLSVAKVRRNPASFRKWLREKLMNDLPDPKYPAIYLHSNNADLTLPLKDEFQYLLAPENAYTFCLGSVIGTHAGPGAVGLSYVTKSKE